MMLFQWGTYDWGERPAFEVNLTRQLIVAEDEDDEPRQLRLIFRFDSSVAGQAGQGNRWCHAPDELAEFRQFIVDSLALAAISRKSPQSIDLRYGRG